MTDEDNKAARIRALQTQLGQERASADRTAAELHRLRQGRELWTWSSYEEQDRAMHALEEQLADLPRSGCIGSKCLSGHRARLNYGPPMVYNVTPGPNQNWGCAGGK